MSDYESALLETWQRKPDAIPVLLSDNLWKEREIAALREQLATTASDGEQTCSACEQLGQAPSPDHLASVARYSAGVAQLVETQLLRERIIELAEANDALERERDAIQRGWNDDRRRSDEAIDAHMARWKRAEAERDALQARAERAEAALALAERESAEFSPWIAKMARTCRICDQVGLTGQIDHAPDCPFAVLAAAPEARDE